MIVRFLFVCFYLWVSATYAMTNAERDVVHQALHLCDCKDLEQPPRMSTFAPLLEQS